MMLPKKVNSNKVSITIYNSTGSSIHLEDDRDNLLSPKVERFYGDIYKLVKRNEEVNDICETSDKLYTDIWIYSIEK